MITAYRLSISSIESNWQFINRLVEQVYRAAPLPIDEYTKAIEPGKNATFIMGLFDNEVLVGLILYRTTGSEIDLREILISEQYQKKGIGSKFLAEFILEIRENLYKNQENSHSRYITLQVCSDNNKLILFYKKVGFTKIASRYPYPHLIKHDLMELDLHK